MASLRRAPPTHQSEQKRLQDNRTREMKVAAFAQDVKRQNLLDAQIASDERVDIRRHLRQQEALRSEIEKEKQYEFREWREAQKKHAVEQENALAAELKRRQLAEESEARMKQQVKENSIELRELTRALQAAYCARERAAQTEEKRLIEHDQRMREAELAAEMRAEAMKAENAAAKKEVIMAQEREIYKSALQQQLAEKEAEKQAAYEEFLKEKLMIDEIVRRIYEEDEKAQQLKMEKRNTTQRYINDFLKAREEWKRREREAMEAENRKIMEFANMQQRREADKLAEVRRREAVKEKLHQKLTAEMQAAEAEKLEMERIITELRMEEQEEADREKERKEMEKRIRDRIRLQEAYHEQLLIKQMKKQAEEEEEEDYRARMAAKFAEDDKIEQMNAQKRRMKQQEHKRAIEKLIIERREMKLQERQDELAAQKEGEAMEQFRRQIIEEERRKLLAQHAEKLIGFLPKGVFRDAGDLEVLPEDVRKKFTERQVDPFSFDGY